MTGFSETSSVQAAIVQRLVTLGWEHLQGSDLPRALDGAFLESHLTPAVAALNPTVSADPRRVDEILPRLRAAALAAVNDGLVAANERMTTWLRGHQTVQYIG